MKPKPKAILFGEMLTDNICLDKGKQLANVEKWDVFAGGAPCNTAIGGQRLGVHTAFVGGFAPDQPGQMLRALLEAEGVDVTGAVFIPGTQTRKVFVLTDKNGDRQFADFTRHNCADAAFSKAHMQGVEGLFDTAHLFGFGSISLIDPTSEEATMTGISLAKSKGLICYMDPNLRLRLWDSAKTCQRVVLDKLKHAEIVKISDEELKFLCDSDDDLITLAEQFRVAHGITVLLLTRGPHGAIVVNSSGHGDVSGFTIKKVVETTGAGDAFNAGFQTSLIDYFDHNANGGLSRTELLARLPLMQLVEMTRYACMAGALACTKAGAIPSMPTLTELHDFAQTHPRE